MFAQNGDSTAYVMHENGYVNFYEEDCFLSIAWPSMPSQEILNALLKAFDQGLETGVKVGSNRTRREIRVALGIESQDA